MVELTETSVRDYLRLQELFPANASIRVNELSGGVSNRVFRIETNSDCLILKQPFENLAVERDWPADVTRVHNEANAARAFASILADQSVDTIMVPEVIHENADDHIIGIECGPADAETWKQALLDRRIDSTVAELAGRVLGTVHRVTSTDTELRSRFPSKRPFKQLRIEPYHEATAETHQDVADSIMAEAERVLAVDKALVHGDYSPKNLLLDHSGTSTAVWILDFEVAHWGDPAFDVAFMLNHLFIKSVYNHDVGESYVDAARSFYGAYQAAVPWDDESVMLNELAVLMLARIDGKSPVEYVTDEKVATALRQIAKRALNTQPSSLAEFAELVTVERERL